MEGRQVHPKRRSPAVLACALTVSLGCWALLNAPGAALAEEPQRTEEDFIQRVNEQLGLLDSSIIMLNLDTEPGKSQDVTVTIEGQIYLLELVPHSVRTAGYRVFTEPAEDTLIEHEPSPVRTVRGTVVGLPESAVAGSIFDTGLYARIDLGEGDIYWVEPLIGRIDGALAGEHALYHQDDVIPPEGICGNLAGDVMGHVDQTQQGQGQRVAAGGEICGVTELACDADNEYYVAHGSSVANFQKRINAVINLMNVQYENQVDITHNITVIVIHNTGNPHGNPYTSSDAETLLFQFRNHWNSGAHPLSTFPRDVAQLFTGKNLNGGTVGIAFVGVICNPLGFAYGVVQSDCCNGGSLSCAADLSAHELGHNWNALHCSCNTTMNGGLLCVLNFGPAAISAITNFRNTRTCLDCPEAGTHTLPLCDIFPTTDFDGEKWTGIDDATIDGVGVDEPSPPNAMRINGSDEIRSAKINISNEEEVFVSYWWQRTGGGNSPEPGEDLLVEYQISDDTWVVLNSHPGEGPDDDPFQFVSLLLPPDAYHSQFRLRFRGTGPQPLVDDWFIDDVCIDLPPEDATTKLPFIDTFPSTDLDTSLWIGNDGASVDDVGNGEPSPPFSLNIDGTEEIRSALMDTSGGGLVLTYFWQRTGGGNSPETDDDLFVEYFNNFGLWVEIASHPGDGPDDAPYVAVSIPLPTGALHTDFRIRFRTVGTTGGADGFDDWFVDNVCVGTPAECEIVPECETPLECDDGIFCTDDACSGGFCVHTLNDASCDDGVSCTADVCSADSDCSNTPDDAACDDGNGCTTDTCDAGAGCLNPPDVGAGCNDGSACTENDACDAFGDCVGDDIDCDDGNGCTIDTCNAGSGCQSTADVGASCDDGIKCTENDACDADGACVGDDTNCPDIVELVGQINNDLPICQDTGADEIDTPLMVCDVYAQFLSANDLLTSVAFADISTTSPSGFFQHPFASNTPPGCALVEVFPDMVCDSFVTLTNECNDGSDATATDPDFNINPDDPDNPLDWFNEGGRVFGGWFNADPTNDQSIPGADLRILVARLSVPVGFSISGTLDAFVKVNGQLPIVVVPNLFFECAGGLGCNEACPTDVNGDNNTGPADLAALLGCWGPATAGVCLCLDTNGDGQINPVDLAVLLAAWGACP